MIDLKAKCKTLRLLQDDIREQLDDLGSGDDILDITPEAQSMKEGTKKLHFINMEIFCSAKHSVKRMRRCGTDWEKIFAKTRYTKGLLSQIYEESLKLIMKMENPIKK